MTKQDAYQAFAARLLEACADDPTMPKQTDRGFFKALGLRGGIGYKGAEKWVKGLGMPDMGHSTILAQNLNVSLEWLMTGRGFKRVGTIAIAESAAQYQPSAEVTQLTRTIAALPPEISDAISRLIDACLKHK